MTEKFPGKPKRLSESGDPERFSELTGINQFKGNHPGIDTYDDGMDAEGKLVRPGSTATESGGTYMEDEGPIDLVHRAGERYRELGSSDGLHVADGLPEEQPPTKRARRGADPETDADAWMKKHGHKWE